MSLREAIEQLCNTAKSAADLIEEEYLSNTADNLREYSEEAMKEVEKAERLFDSIASACGLPDPAEACRVILKLCEEASQ